MFISGSTAAARGHQEAADQAPGQPAGAAARALELSKTYGSGELAVQALDRVTVGFARGQLTAVMGPSGSGKSTLLHCLAALDRPSSGRALIGDQDIALLDDRRLTRLRRDRLGFIFQAFNLVSTLSAGDNIMLPAKLAGTPVDPAWFDELVRRLGIERRIDHRPGELSGGQQQRVACARALLGRPELVFADEPTGNLDSAASGEVLAFLRGAVDDHGQAIVMVTHDPHAAAYADRVVFLADGRLVGELDDPTADSVLEQVKKLVG